MPPTLPSGAIPPSILALPSVNLLSSSLPPIQHLPRLSSHLSASAQIYAYHEDLSSSFFPGGSKLRKLEYVIGRFLSPATPEDKAATVLLTEGGIQSNHTRQTAAAAASLGLKCVLLLSPWTQSDDPNYEKLGNIQLCRMLGADVRMIGKAEAMSAPETVRTTLEANGEVVAWIPAGSSLDERGGVGYARWIFELLVQEQAVLPKAELFSHVVVTCVSGSTLGGMIAGLKLAEKSGMLEKGRIKLLGIDGSGKDLEGQRNLVLKISQTTAKVIGLEETEWPVLEDVHIDGRWSAGEYGKCDSHTKEAMKLVARLEGLITDPVYTGKGSKGLIEGVKEASLTGNVLFVHTGGQVALNVYGGVEND